MAISGFLFRTVPKKVATILGWSPRTASASHPGSNVGERVSLRGATLGGNNSIGHDTAITGKVDIGYASTIGHNCVMVGEISIGRYCQFAPYSAAYATTHATSYLSIYVNKRLFDRELQRNNRHRPIRIGSDVWVGHGVVILPGVNIGNGAVIGASAVVTKPIPAFSIAVGNPARVIGNRFPEEVISLIEELAWWELDPKDLSVIKDAFFQDLAEGGPRVCEALRDAIQTIKRSGSRISSRASAP